MARKDRRGESARLNAKSQARGFTSRGQEYRARKKGYRQESGEAYNAALDAKRTGQIARREGGDLLGYKSTGAGVILSAHLANTDDAAGCRPLQIAVNRFSPERRASITWAPDNGNIHAYARFGGIKVGQVQGDPNDPPLLAYVIEQEDNYYDEGDDTGGVLTVVIA